MNPAVDQIRHYEQELEDENNRLESIIIERYKLESNRLIQPYGRWKR